MKRYSEGETVALVVLILAAIAMAPSENPILASVGTIAAFIALLLGVLGGKDYKK